MKNRAQGETSRMTKSNETERSQSSETLTRRQRAVLPYLITAPSLEEGCQKARVSKTTVYAWLKEPGFQAELKRLRQAMVDEAFDRLKSGLTQAVDKLLELLQAEGQPGIQLRAAQTLLDQGIKVVELQDLETRLETLEEQLLNHRGNRWR